MTYHGHVENGTIILDEPAALPEGAKVAVALVEPKAEDEETRSIPTLYERLKCVIGKAKGLPPDLALNHDHYLHGQPKR